MSEPRINTQYTDVQIADDFIKALNLHNNLIFECYEYKLIEEKECQTALKNIWAGFFRKYFNPGNPCQYKPESRCTKPDDMKCAQLDCLVWKDIDGD